MRKYLSKPKKKNGLAYDGFIALAVIIIATFASLLQFPAIDAGNIILLYLLGVTIAGCFSRRSAFIAALLCVGVYDFFFIPTYFSFGIEHADDYFTLLVILVVALLLIYY